MTCSGDLPAAVAYPVTRLTSNAGAEPTRSYTQHAAHLTHTPAPTSIMGTEGRPPASGQLPSTEGRPGAISIANRVRGMCAGGICCTQAVAGMTSGIFTYCNPHRVMRGEPEADARSRSRSASSDELRAMPRR
jgi:hypothetical protein